MLKHLSLAVVFLALLASTGCKKCYRCVNECSVCTITVGANAFSKSYCSDSFNTATEYRNALSADSASGYVCARSASTYNYEFCVEKNGEEQYLYYFSKNKKVTCNEK